MNSLLEETDKIVKAAMKEDLMFVLMIPYLTVAGIN